LQQNLAHEVGDFIVKRADGLFAYQLAVVVDDAFQGITHVVRGADLVWNTPRQIYLQTLLGLPTPVYAHVPLITNAAGQKLSKQTLAPALPERGRGPCWRGPSPRSAIRRRLNWRGRADRTAGVGKRLLADRKRANPASGCQAAKPPTIYP